MAKGKKKPPKQTKAEAEGEAAPVKPIEVPVEITPDAQTQFEALPLPIKGQIRNVYARLAKWPKVSGYMSLKGNLAGSYRIRSGDYRVVFRLTGGKVEVWKIGDRKDVYLN